MIANEKLGPRAATVLSAEQLTTDAQRALRLAMPTRGLYCVITDDRCIIVRDCEVNLRGWRFRDCGFYCENTGGPLEPVYTRIGKPEPDDTPKYCTTFAIDDRYYLVITELGDTSPDSREAEVMAGKAEIAVAKLGFLDQERMARGFEAQHMAPRTSGPFAGAHLEFCVGDAGLMWLVIGRDGNPLRKANGEPFGISFVMTDPDAVPPGTRSVETLESAVAADLGC